MARRPSASQRRRYAELVQKLEPELRAAFEESIRDLRAGVDWPRLIRALEDRNIEAAIRALKIEPAAFYRYGASKTAAFAESGALTSTLVDFGAGQSLQIRFDMTNTGAERWIRQNVGGRITGLADDQIAAVREVIESGYAAGRNPITIGRDIAGRVVNGSRQGGVIGLDTERARRLTSVTRGMETAEGVQDLVYKDRAGKLRVRFKVNPATEKRIIKAYNAGTGVPAGERAISLRQYENALLKARADTIARTETAQAVRGAQAEAWQQVMDREGIPEQAVIKTWIHGGGVKDPRPHHVAANGMTVRGLNTPFVLASGVSLLYPHDPSAPGSETINCTCGHEIRRDPTWEAPVDTTAEAQRISESLLGMSPEEFGRQVRRRR